MKEIRWYRAPSTSCNNVALYSLALFIQRREGEKTTEKNRRACADRGRGGGYKYASDPMIIVLYTAQHVPFASTAKHSALRSRHRSYVHVYNVICNTNIETLNSLYNQTEKSHFRRKWNSDYQI